MKHILVGQHVSRQNKSYVITEVTEFLVILTELPVTKGLVKVIGKKEFVKSGFELSIVEPHNKSNCNEATSN